MQERIGCSNSCDAARREKSGTSRERHYQDVKLADFHNAFNKILWACCMLHPPASFIIFIAREMD